ncbi:hypothetical protein [Flavobacterium sp. WV_118_3]|uniref:hypothetical protein n=1 Tax=Flavobacterium sp. WV_118_3 TaxID=3151764 RepID=UPI00321A995A
MLIQSIVLKQIDNGKIEIILHREKILDIENAIPSVKSIEIRDNDQSLKSRYFRFERKASEISKEAFGEDVQVRVQKKANKYEIT